MKRAVTEHGPHPSNLTMGDEPNGSEEQLAAWVRAAAEGDREAAHEVLRAIQDRVYRLALRMLGHPQDAEDATQEISLIVLTHFGSFRGESAFSTWVWTIAARRLMEVKRGRRESDSFEALGERLESLRHEPPASCDPESAVFAHEVRLRCTGAMILSLDRSSRIAYLLGDIFNLPGEEAAAVLGIDPAAFRKRLARARQRLYDFMRRQCGVFDAANACRCERVAGGAAARGLLRPEELLFARHPTRGASGVLDRAAQEVTELMRVAEVLRDHPDYAAPESLVARLRELLASRRLELLRH
jgi:RNA polymerase sigma factor (sigma-70 family)